MTEKGLRPGDVVVVDLGRGVGGEQGGSRPAVVVSTTHHLALHDGLAVVVPCTSTQRGWRSHVPVDGDVRLTRATFAMTEQVRAVSPKRIRGRLGRVGDDCRQRIAYSVQGWIDQPPLFRR